MIPKHIHQIWIGEEIPPKWKKECLRIKDAHPEYRYSLWNNEKILELSKELPSNAKEKFDMFYNAKVYAFATDIMRLYVLYKYGGIYMDTDFVLKEGSNMSCLPLDEKDLLLLNLRLGPLFFKVHNCFIASSQGNAYIKRCIDNIGIQGYILTDLTGKPCEKYSTQYMTTEYLLHKFPEYKGPLPVSKIIHRNPKNINLNKLFMPNDARLSHIYFQNGKKSTIANHKRILTHQDGHLKK